MQHVAHTQSRRIGQEDEAQVGGRLVVVKLVVCGAEADEGVVIAAELAHHVAEGEDGTEDELGIVGGRGEVGRGAVVGGEPGFGVDAFGWERAKRGSC